MAEYIEREALAAKLQAHRRLFLDAYGDFCYLSAKDKARVDEMSNSIAEVFNAPAADVAPVVHAKWIHKGPRVHLGVNWWGCSACGDESGAQWMRYCPNCGARMDGE